MESQKDQIRSFLSAFPRKIVISALKDFYLRGSEGKVKGGWRRHESGKDIPPGHDWTVINGKVFIRSSTQDAKTVESATNLSKSTTPQKSHELLKCPKCGDRAFRSSVCPNCAKGKAGIRNQYICGECNFVFYTEG